MIRSVVCCFTLSFSFFARYHNSAPKYLLAQLIFKGIWTKHLQYYLDNANSAARTAKYSPFLGAQASAVWHYGTSGSNDIGSVWYAPDAGGSIFKSQSATSGLAALIAAAKVRQSPRLFCTGRA
jgi:superoxide dismutase